MATGREQQHVTVTTKSAHLLSAGLGATKRGQMAPNFLQATPDAVLRFMSSSAVNRKVASPNLARGAKSFVLNRF
jgi:hypothetical protein